MPEATSEYRKPLPEPTELSQPFWDGTKLGRLLIQRCGDCGHYWWTPQLACPICLTENWAWTDVSGRGAVYSFTIVHRAPDPVAFADDVPYVVAVVQLDEGPHMLTNVIGCPTEQVYVEMPVEVSFEKATEEITLYKFRPVGKTA